MKDFYNKVINNKIFKLIYNIIRYFVLIVLVIYLGFTLYQRITNNGALFGYRVFTVATGSMEPVYNVNDVILIKEIPAKELKVGDDISYVGDRAGLEGLVITHRIIDIEKQNNNKIRLYTKGVNNEIEDPSIMEDQVLGKVCGKVFLVNQINHIVKNRFGFFFLIFLPLSLIIILEVLESIFEGKIERHEIEKYGSKSKSYSNKMQEIETIEKEEKVIEPSKEEDKKDEEEII